MSANLQARRPGVRPVVAITTGEPAGIGPEIAIRANLFLKFHGNRFGRVRVGQTSRATEEPNQRRPGSSRSAGDYASLRHDAARENERCRSL